jgi:hypothetical protein
VLGSAQKQSERADLLQPTPLSRPTSHLHSLDPLGTRWPRFKRVTEILGLTENVFILKFHDTHRIRWLPIVSEDEFGYPEIGSTNNSPH